MPKKMYVLIAGVLAIPLLGGVTYAASHAVSADPEPEVVIPETSTTVDNNSTDSTAPGENILDLTDTTVDTTVDTSTTIVDDNSVDGPGHDVGDDNGVDGPGHDVGDDNGVDGPGHDVGDDNGVEGSSDDATDDDESTSTTVSPSTTTPPVTVAVTGSGKGRGGRDG